MSKKKITKISYREWADAVEDYDELKKASDEAYEHLRTLNRNKIVDNCPDCEGVGTTEVPCDPALGDTRTTTCQKCKGKGYAG